MTDPGEKIRAVAGVLPAVWKVRLFPAEWLKMKMAGTSAAIRAAGHRGKPHAVRDARGRVRVHLPVHVEGVPALVRDLLDRVLGVEGRDGAVQARPTVPPASVGRCGSETAISLYSSTSTSFAVGPPGP